MKNYKRLLLMGSLLFLLLILSACSTAPISENSTGVWDRYIVYYFAEAIKGLSLSNNLGMGIILFTIIIRLVLLPLMHYQTKSMRKMQEIQPKLKEIQQQYSAKDPDTQRQLREAQQQLYAKSNVNPYAGCLPLLIQMPIMMALYQSISRVPELKQGTFLWLNLGQPDTYFVLPILAAIFTFASSYLMSLSQLESNASVKIMNYAMPILIFVMGMNLASGLSLYWTVSNAFQVGQTLVLNNPFKILKEREEKANQQKEREKALKKAKNPKKKQKRKS